MDTSEQDLRRQAERRVKAKRDFRSNLVSYVVVNAFLIGVWAFTGAGYFWPGWVLLGWGVGLVFHWWDVYGRKPVTEDEVRREMDRLRAEGAAIDPPASPNPDQEG
jgi:hypothetical protein